MKNNILKQLSSGLIVSCQALPDEPLHSSFIMGKMALAAKQGGAVAIRANGKEDIAEIKQNIDLPVIGIVKRDYIDSDVYITPTIKEVKELLEVNVEVIAIDATNNIRPNNTTLDQLIKEIKEIAPNQILMADCSTLEEAKKAIELDFDIISTTLVGYTKQSQGMDLSDNNYDLFKQFVSIAHKANKFFIAEGKVDTEEKLQNAINLGVDGIVIGSQITRPQIITEKYVNFINGAKAHKC